MTRICSCTASGRTFPSWRSETCKLLAPSRRAKPEFADAGSNDVLKHVQCVVTGEKTVKQVLREAGNDV